MRQAEAQAVVGQPYLLAKRSSIAALSAYFSLITEIVAGI